MGSAGLKGSDGVRKNSRITSLRKKLSRSGRKKGEEVFILHIV